MRTYVVWLRRKIVGTVVAPSDDEACVLVVTMWGGQTTMQRTTEAAPWDTYEALCKDEQADYAGREAEILFKIGREP